MPSQHPPDRSDGLRIRVLGPLEVAVDGAPLVVDTRKALAILALLAVERRPFAREELATLLWSEADDESARGALRRTLSVLRAALGDRWLVVDRATVGLEQATAAADLGLVEAAAASHDLATLLAAADAARGPFLAGFSLRDSPDFDDWRATRATAVERQVAAILDRLADAALRAGETATAVAAAGRRVDLDPLDEAAHRRLMAVLAGTGDRAGAIRQYRACVAVLERELGVAPLAETTALYDEIRDGAFAARPDTQVRTVPAAPPPVPFRLPLVGRDDELARLEAARASAAIDGTLATVTGEAGIGKSALVDALAAHAAAAGAAVIGARAWPTETGVAYGTVVGLLRAGLAQQDGVVRLRALPASTLDEVARLVDLPDGLGTPGRRPALEDPGPAAHARLLDAVGAAIGALAGPPGGLVVVEDVQWVDDASREALGWLVRRSRGRPFLLVLTWRPEDLDELAATFAASLEARPPDAEVALGRLDRSDVARLVAAAAAAGIGTPDAAALAEESEGLPLFVAEALLGGAAGGDQARSVRALLRERVASVGETAGQVLAAAAVIGRSFDLASARAVSGRSEDETVTALEELVRRGLVREVAGDRGPGGWDFAHARLREAADDATSLARRRILHRRAADHLRADPALRSDPGRLAQVAAHELAAGRDAEASEAFREAGLQARALHANREAAAHLEAAIALGHPDTAGLQVALGDARTALGDYRAAIGALEAAAAWLPDSDLPEVEVRLGRAHARRGDLPTAASHLDAAVDALAAAVPIDALALARALVERALVAQRADDPDGATAAATRALQLAERAGDAGATAAAYRVLGLAARDRGDLPGAAAALERSLALAAGDPDGGPAIAARNALALVRASTGDRDGAIELLEAAIAAAGRTGERHLEAALENNLADQLHAAGRGEEAMDHLKRAVAAFAEVGGRPGELEPEIWKLVTW